MVQPRAVFGKLVFGKLGIYHIAKHFGCHKNSIDILASLPYLPLKPRKFICWENDHWLMWLLLKPTLDLNRDWDFTDDKKLQRGVICRKHQTVLVWSNEWKLLQRQASMHWIKMDWQQHYSYAQKSPFKSIEFEIFAQKSQFPHVQILQIHNNADLTCPWPGIDQAAFHNPKWFRLGVKNMGSSVGNNIFGVGGWTFFILSAGGKITPMMFPRYKTPTLLKNTILLLLVKADFN